jgi:hypothetical protein
MCYMELVGKMVSKLAAMSWGYFLGIFFVIWKMTTCISVKGTPSHYWNMLLIT